MVDNDSSRWGGVEFTNGKKPGVRGAPTEADALIDRAACHRGVAATRRSQLLEAFAARTLSHSHSRGSGNLLDCGVRKSYPPR
jgi:hypothetical protein